MSPDQSSRAQITLMQARAGAIIAGRQANGQQKSRRPRATNQGNAPVWDECGIASGSGPLLDHPDRQRFAACRDGEKAIDVRVRARAIAGVGGVFGENGEAVFGRFPIKRA